MELISANLQTHHNLQYDSSLVPPEALFPLRFIITVSPPYGINHRNPR